MKKPKPDLLNGIQVSWSLTPTDEAQKHRQVPVVPRMQGAPLRGSMLQGVKGRAREALQDTSHLHAHAIGGLLGCAACTTGPEEL